MSKILNECIDAVDVLNDQLYGPQDLGNTLGISFTVSTDGYAYLIKFLGCVLYDSENSQLRYTDESETEQETIREYTTRVADHLVSAIKTLNFGVDEIVEYVSPADLRDLISSEKQAWDICDAVAEALGDDLDHELGSAQSIINLKARLNQ